MELHEMYELAKQEGRTLLGHLGDKTPVFSEKGVNQLANHQQVEGVLQEALDFLSTQDFLGPRLRAIIDLGRPVGISTFVETTEADTIVYARRKGCKDGCTRFVVGRSGVDCSTVIVILNINDDDFVTLTTAFIGVETGPEPCSPSGRSSVQVWLHACECWKNHAICIEGEDVEDITFTEKDFFGEPPAI